LLPDLFHITGIITKKSVVSTLEMILHTQSFLKVRLFASEKRIAVVVFAACIALRMVPELIAYPHPIGYDVVNYYIPTVAHFDENWNTIANQFPLYVILLYLASVITGLPTQPVVVGVAVLMAGIFGMSLFFIARHLLKLGVTQSAFLAIFAVFQVAILRTMWDLHKDIFSLTTMLFALSLLARKETTWKPFAAMIALATLTVAADRMIGILFCVTVSANAIMTRRKEVILTAIVSVVIFYALIAGGYDFFTSNTTSAQNSSNKPDNKTPEFYTPTNLLTLFAVVNGLIIVPAAIGFFIRKNRLLLKIPLILSLVGSFSWLAFPENSSLVADRWIVLTGIFLSIFAAYGILNLVKNLKPNLSALVAGSILASFAFIGLAYSVMPHDSPFILYGVVRANIEKFGPVTMQFNSLDIDDNNNLLSAIEWLNKNTEHDAIVVGEKHWRGFMDMNLEDERTYVSSDDARLLAQNLVAQGKPAYLISAVGSLQTNFTIEHKAKR
jgi:hypothetical protein